MRRRGFTILELLMVVVVISILMTIVVAAMKSAISMARGQRAEANLHAWQAAIATFRATDPQGRWPGALQNVADSGLTRMLSQSEAQNVFRIIVQKSVGESGPALPLLDPHLLYVAPSGAIEGKSAGRMYDEARRGDRRHRPLPVAQMEFGRQTAKGKFYPYYIVYHAESDAVTVHGCCQKCMSVNGCTKDEKRCECH